MIDKRLLRAVPGSMRLVLFNVVAQWGSLICNVATILAIGWFVGGLLTGTAPSIITLLLITLPATALRFAFTLLSGHLSHQSSGKVKLALRHKIYEKLLQLGPAYHTQVGTSEAVQMAVEGVDQLEVYFGRYLPQLFYSLAAPLTLFIVLCTIDAAPAAILLACVPLIPVSIVAVQRFAKKLLAKYWGKYTALGDGFLEDLQGLTTLKIFGSDGHKHKEMNQRAEEFRKVTMKVLVMQLNSITIMDLIAYGGAAAGIIIAVSRFTAGYVGFAGALCIILLAADFFIPLRLLGSFFHIAMNGMAAADKIFGLLQLPTPEKGREAAIPGYAAIALENVSFSYTEDRPILQNITLKAGHGLTAIVGESGSGKSTIAGLLTGQNSGFTGSVTIGGVPVNALSPAAHAQTVNLVPHDGYLFKGTVRENLLVAIPAAKDETLWQALEAVNLAAYLKGENGLDTPLLEKAANLSGGQRQRLVLARALLQDSPVYIFDEATSNIDVESENDIAAVIWQLAKTKTVLLISHRLANTVPADTIFVLENGRLCESGGHAALLAQNGVYAQLYTAQQALEGYAAGKEAAHA